MRKIGFLIIVLSVCFLFSCKKKKAPVVETLAVVTTEEVKPVTESPKEAPKPAVKEYTHFLVGGCFRIKENADRFQAKLENEGYPSEILPYFHNLQLVTYKGFYSHGEAQIALNQMVLEPGKELTWIYPVR